MSLLSVVAVHPLPAMLLSLLLWAAAMEASQQQSPLLGFSDHDQHQHLEHIAIIGAGIGGASTVFELHKRSRNLPSTRKVTIFERQGEVGGRIKSTYLYPGEGSRKWIEEGATHFYAGDWCVNSAMEYVGLKPVLPLPWPASWSTAHWRSDDVRREIECNAGSSAWWDLVYGVWKYGSSWRALRSAVLSTLDAWTSFASPYAQPVTSITQELTRAGLSRPVIGPATAYLQNLSISPALQNEFIQPCTRGRALQHLSSLSAFSALLASGRSTTVSIDGGNNQLVERMTRLSHADLRTNTLVTSISPGHTRRYALSISHLTSQHSSRAEVIEFDTIILAAPLQSIGLDLSRLGLTVLSFQGISTHVTHFSSPVAISTNLSSLPLDMSFRGELTLTTSDTASHILHLRQTSACFKRYECSFDDDCDECDEDEFLFRVHSESHLADGDLVRMIGQQWQHGAKLDDYGIHYVRRQVWPYSYPQSGAEFLDEVEIAPNFWYLSGAESILSSMEMSCRMGRNVAKLVHRRT